jgi:hypothetical protein
MYSPPHAWKSAAEAGPGASDRIPRTVYNSVVIVKCIGKRVEGVSKPIRGGWGRTK